jgi:AraC-like DNA-binding protein
MATATIALRRPEPLLSPHPNDGALGRVRDLLDDLARGDGHTSVFEPDVCLYRFGAPGTFTKAETYGLTLGMVLQGAKRVRVDGRAFPVTPGRAIVVTRACPLETTVDEAGRDRPYLGLGICFAPERVARALLALADAGGAQTPETVPAFVLDCDSNIADAVERLLRTLGDPLDRKLLAPLILDEILFRLLRSEAAAAVRAGVGPAADAQRILEAMRLIRENHADKLSVDELARKVAMSPSHFAHRFSAVARVSPMRYLREVRLDAARSRLASDGARVSEVAVAVGFESPAHFTREFKRRFGVSPSKTRASG